MPAGACRCAVAAGHADSRWADAAEQLAPQAPLVARPHRLRADVGQGEEEREEVVTVEVGPALPWDHPMLVALPALWPG